ncbi:TetR/AcrR family transcriptional regulator [Cohnella lubricantis]|uniref:TetR/AcrR family transcriptional regulator n=1 Tax=Cohnella lubricantis TaxID=2163172 RepID=UPI002892F33F|nr:TetR/AcrR family transcriptional regulator [Cohnella lubricantis]MBP2118041.1 AcrR family transcriptional regulator [Cohnella lubricantis]
MPQLSHQEETTARLKEALLALLSDKDIRRVTAKEIADSAQVSRATFYTLFEDKYALFGEIVEEMREGLSEAIRQSLRNKVSLDLQHVELKVHPTLRYVAEHRAFFRTMINRSMKPYVNFHRFFLEVFREDVALEPQEPNLSRMARDLYAHYMTLYLYSILLFWVKEGLQSTPEEMSRRFWR